MKKSITLALTDEELIELQKIIPDEDRKETLCFLQNHFKDKARATLEGGGHYKPYLEMRGQSPMPDEASKKV